MSLTDLIYAKTGIRIGAEKSGADHESQMLMVLNVISADNRTDAAEIRLLAALIEGLHIPDKTMSVVYERYFAR